MANKINKERRERLEPGRMTNAKNAFRERSIPFIQLDEKTLEFELNGYVNKYFVYTGWATGKGITDGRGLKKLLKQFDI